MVSGLVLKTHSAHLHTAAQYVYNQSVHTVAHNHMGVPFSHGHKAAHILPYTCSAKATYMSAFYKFQQTLTNNRKSHTYTLRVTYRRRGREATQLSINSLNAYKTIQ